MCRSYIILSQLWRLFINTNQSPLHLAKSHALVPMHALYTDKEIRRTHTQTPHVWRTHMHIANKEKDTSGWVPYHGSENWPPHTDKKTELTQVTTCIRAPNAQMKARVLHITNTKHTQTNKMHARTRAHTHPLTHWHARTLQLIGRQVSGEEEKVPVQHIQAEYAISSS